jgi:hypothetical protein
MRRIHAILGALAVIGLMCVSALPGPVHAQATASDANRDCQTIRRCNFSRTGSFRGCISAYSCRSCRLIPARCTIGNRSANCRQMRCNWGA